jgi:hypothetical protein
MSGWDDLVFHAHHGQGAEHRPISQQSLYVLALLAYHGYEGVALNDAERPPPIWGTASLPRDRIEPRKMGRSANR